MKVQQENPSRYLRIRNTANRYQGVSLRKYSELDSHDKVFHNCVSIISKHKKHKSSANLSIQNPRVVNSDLLDSVFS